MFNKYNAAAILTIRNRGFADENVSITPDNSGSGSKTNSGSESSGDAAPAMMRARRIGFFNVAVILTISVSPFQSILPLLGQIHNRVLASMFYPN